MSARQTILSRVQKACDPENNNAAPDVGSNRAELLARMPADVQLRINHPERLTQPSVPANIVDTLIERMEAVQMTITRLQSSDDVVAAVDWYLQENNIDGDMRVSPALQHLQWPDKTGYGAAQASDTTGVNTVKAAIAETGSLVFQTDNDSPATLNFLPENQVVVVYESQVVSHLEGAWQKTMGEDGDVPRAINLVTGPSRTGDIEQTIELGAHGPKRVHVLLVSADPATRE